MSGRFLALGAPLAAVLLLLALTPLGTRAEPTAPMSIIGNYRVQGSGMIIAIADCGEGKLCGRIAGLAAPQQQQSAQQKLAPQRADQLCGLTVLTELQPTRIGWQGKFRDPVLGGDYRLDIDISRGMSGGPTLMVQRYSAPPFLTRTMARQEAWVSVAPPSTPCGTPAPTS